MLDSLKTECQHQENLLRIKSMKYFSILLVALVIGCKSSKVMLDENPNVTIKESFYKVIPAAIKEGNTFVNITLDVETNSPEAIEIIGVYFMGDYTTIKQKTTNKQYIGTIIQSEKKEKMENFPFELKTDEFVLQYKEGNKVKYGLFKIKRKDNLNDVPM